MNSWIFSLAANIAIMLLLIGLGSILSRSRNLIGRLDFALIPFAVGAMLAIVWFEFVPHLSHELSETVFAALIVSGILGFGLLENLLHWHHCRDLEESHDHHHAKEEECVHDIHAKHSGLMTVGTFFHNCFHGVVLFGAFSIDFTAGILLTFVILLHAIPQNLANTFMNRDSLISLAIAASGGVVGSLLIFPFLSFGASFEFAVLALTAFDAGGLLYIALSDLLPIVQNRADLRHRFGGMALVALGVLIVALAQTQLHKYTEPDGHGNHTEAVEEFHTDAR